MLKQYYLRKILYKVVVAHNEDISEDHLQAHSRACQADFVKGVRHNGCQPRSTPADGETLLKEAVTVHCISRYRTSL